MKSISKIILFAFFTMVANYGFSKTTGDLNKPQPKNNDTTVLSTKSNIVIFKMIPTPTYINSGGSLKKGGKVARTSNSRS